MKFVYLGLLFLITILHLAASYKNSREYRLLTKGLILPMIWGFYLESGAAVLPALVAALIFSWAGDLLLMWPGVKWFVIGGCSFIISHILFIVVYAGLTDFSLVPVWAIVLAACVFAFAVGLVFRKLSPHLPSRLVLPMSVYLLINGAMNCFAVFRAMSAGTFGSVVTAFGAALFFASDTTLFFVRFNKKSRMKSHFLPMLTYILGEFLIVLGMVI